jgi:hypothetical protein
MMHPCEVQALAHNWRRRLRDRVVYRHALHECDLDRPGFREHYGDHRCVCGLTFAKQATDNDPPLRPRRPE